VNKSADCFVVREVKLRHQNVGVGSSTAVQAPTLTFHHVLLDLASFSAIRALFRHLNNNLMELVI
jgi:hypothetical protein